MSREEWKSIAFFATIYIGITIYGCVDLQAFEEALENFITGAFILCIFVMWLNNLFNVSFIASPLIMLALGLLGFIIKILFVPVYAYDLVDKTYLNPPKSSIEILEDNFDYRDQVVKEREKMCIIRSGLDAPYCKDTWFHKERIECYNDLSQKNLTN